MRTSLLQLGWLLAVSLSFSTVGLAQIDPASSLARPDPSAPAPLPFFDVRLQADGQPVESVLAANDLARSAQAIAARALQAARLKAEIAGLRIDDHQLFETPVWVASTLRFLTPALGSPTFDPQSVVRSFVGQHRALFEIDPSELTVARIARNFRTAHNGMRHLTFQQQIGGIDLYGCEVKANVTPKGELVNVSSSMLPRPADGFAVPQTLVDPRDALYLAAASIGAVVTSELEPLGAPAGATRLQTWAPTQDFRSDVAITTALVYFPRSRTDIRPAWSLVLPEKGIGNTYEMIVDATNGEVLRRWNQLHFFGGTQPITMRVYTSDSPAPGSPGWPTPTTAQFPFVARQLLTINPADVAASSPNHWINDGGNETLGNNVDAHTDLNNSNFPDLPRPQGSPFRTFDFPLDVTQDPSTYRNAAVTQLFYACNRYHDRTYALGFDEAAGNFQQDNFALGGLGGDPVLADCQDGANIGNANNANFFTPPDGQSGRMQMYIFNGPTPDRDGDLDADIIYHEHSHGLSNRLHGGLSGTQPGGMGEGWSDYFGVSLNAEPGDDPNAAYHTGGYSTFQFFGLTENYYYGIRRFPYSTDFNKFPLTFADIDSAQYSFPGSVPTSPVIGGSPSEVHNVGEVWCNTLLEARTGLWAVYGFAANDLLMQLVVDGMKLSPANPTFLQARDAILQGDLNNNGGINLATLWNAFAKRGMGNSATSPGSGTTSGVVEAYDVPSLILFTYPNGIPTQLQPGSPTTFQVVVQGLSVAQPIAGTGQLHYSINGAPFTAVAMTETSANHYDATLPAGSCLDFYRFYVSSNTTGGVETDPTGVPANAREATVYTALIDLFVDNFETNTGWTATSSGATTGFWERGVPVNASDWDYDPPADSDGSGQCFVTENATGNTDVDNGSVTLTSPTIDMSAGAIRISYDYYLNLTIEDGIDRLLVEINDNGGVGTWTTIATHTTGGGLSWRHHEIDSAELAGAGITLTSQMKLRYTANDGGTQSINESGLDAFKVQALTCSGPFQSYCFGDGTTATACPCGNVGQVGQGCENSASTGGAQLAASGTTSPDTVVLTSNGELPTVLSAFLQGDANAPNGILFGDGVRCVSGALKRLYFKNASAGSVSAPIAGDPSITTQSANLGDPIAPGSTRYYQVYYRDPNLGFCGTPQGDSWNVSNGVSIAW